MEASFFYPCSVLTGTSEIYNSFYLGSDTVRSWPSSSLRHTHRVSHRFVPTPLPTDPAYLPTDPAHLPTDPALSLVRHSDYATVADLESSYTNASADDTTAYSHAYVMSGAASNLEPYSRMDRKGWRSKPVETTASDGDYDRIGNTARSAGKKSAGGSAVEECPYARVNKNSKKSTSAASWNGTGT